MTVVSPLHVECSLCDLSVLYFRIADWVGPYLKKSALWSKQQGWVGDEPNYGVNRLPNYAKPTIMVWRILDWRTTDQGILSCVRAQIGA